jgi:type II secretory pathway pseudopilin PulG
MSILTVITVSQFTTARKKARDVQRKGDLNALTKALTMYFADYGSFPLAAAVNDRWGGEFKDASGYIYMKVLPEEKTSGMPEFCYVVSADQKSYGLFAMLESTTDNDCHMAGGEGEFVRCGANHYCYSVVSSNIEVGDL